MAHQLGEAQDAISQDQGRFGLVVTESMQRTLKQGAACSSMDQALREACDTYREAETVPWRVAYSVCEHLRKERQRSGDDAATSSSAPDGPWLHQLLSADSGLTFSSPPPRQRSGQLQSRIAQLQAELDNKQYAAMVADITQHERAVAAAKDNMLPNTRLQLSFGLHVLVTMGAFFALGYYGGTYTFGKQVWGSLCGTVGMTAALIMETILLIIRTSGIQPLDQKYAHLVETSKMQKTAEQFPARRKAAQPVRQRRGASQQQQTKHMSQQKKED